MLQVSTCELEDGARHNARPALLVTHEAAGLEDTLHGIRCARALGDSPYAITVFSDTGDVLYQVRACA